jgi:hypothetical protein
LFGYAANEEAVIQNNNNEVTMMEIDEPSKSSKPAAQMVWDAKMQVAKSTSTLTRRNSEGLARALLTLLWSAAQSSQPKASRVVKRFTQDAKLAECHILCFHGSIDCS